MPAQADRREENEEMILHLTKNEKDRLYEALAPYLEDTTVQQMDSYIQHGNVTTLEHVLRVTETSVALNRSLHVHADEEVLRVGALLHDYYLYDWHGRSLKYANHGFVHPEIARKNAAEHFQATPEVQAVIRTHMWPFTLLHVPKSREAVLVCVADKYCSLTETLFHRGGKRT